MVNIQHPIIRNVFLTMAISVVTLLILGREENRASSWSPFRESPVSMTSSPSTETIHETAPELSSEKPWPPLSSLVRGSEITGDVQFALDFAIIAHPKTATTFTMNWLASHRDIQMHKRELHALQEGKPADLIRLMYELEPGYQYKRGYKAPRDIINSKVLDAMAKYFPKTGLVVGLRHPVLWFESFYNYRIRGGFKMPPAETLRGDLKQEWYGVSTNESKFHINLDNLRKTSRTEEELALLEGGKKKAYPKSKNPVFLYEVNQLHDSNSTRADLYLQDLQAFLGVEHPLEPIVDSTAGTIEHERPDGVINICDKKYTIIREDLMKSAIEASIWIRTYFLESPDVSVSSPDHFKKLVEEWMIDPCHFR